MLAGPGFAHHVIISPRSSLAAAGHTLGSEFQLVPSRPRCARSTRVLRAPRSSPAASSVGGSEVIRASDAEAVVAQQVVEVVVQLWGRNPSTVPIEDGLLVRRQADGIVAMGERVCDDLRLGWRVQGGRVVPQC